MAYPRAFALVLAVLPGPCAPAGTAAEMAFFPPMRVGTLGPLGSNEISGMVRMTGRDGCFWVHNDRSDRLARIFAIRQSGAVIAQVTITGATNTDWEDIAVGPGPIPGVPYLYIADIGTNLDARSTVSIWRIPEPALPTLDPGQRLHSETAAEIRLRYPSGTQDAEGLIVDPASGSLYLFTRRTGAVDIYRVPNGADGGGVRTLVRLGSLPISNQATGADISPDGTKLLLRTYSQVLLLERRPEEPFEAIFFSGSRVLPTPSEGQGESITWDNRGRDYLTTSEGASAPVHRVFRKVPQASCSTVVEADSPLRFVRGDVIEEGGDDPDRRVNVTDAVAVLDIVRGAREDACRGRADIDDDGALAAADVEALLSALVRGRALAGPYPEPDVDPTADALGCFEADPVEILPEDAEWAYWFAIEPPPAAWKDPAEDVPLWPRGPGGVGFGSPALGTPLGGTPGLAPALYARCVFSVAAPASFERLALAIDYAHGFAAYLNGIEVARRGLSDPGTEVPRDLPASFHRGGVVEETLVCGELLGEGANLLAIEVHGRGTPDARLFFRARLRGFRLADASPPSPPPAMDGNVRLSVEPDGALHLGEEGELRVILDADTAVRGLGFVLAFDPRELRITEIRPSEWLREEALWDVYVSTVRRQAAFVLLVDPDALEGGSLPAGERLEVVRLHASIVAAQETEAHLSFAERTGRLGLATAVTVEGPRTVSPETVELVIPLTRPSRFIRGDTNDDGTVNIADPIHMLGWIFGGRPDPPCTAAADPNGDGAIDVADPIYLLNFLLSGTPPPVGPFPACGPPVLETDVCETPARACP